MKVFGSCRAGVGLQVLTEIIAWRFCRPGCAVGSIIGIEGRDITPRFLKAEHPSK